MSRCDIHSESSRAARRRVKSALNAPSAATGTSAEVFEMSWKRIAHSIKFEPEKADESYIRVRNLFTYSDTAGSAWIEYVTPTDSTNQNSYIVLPEDWLEHGSPNELPFEPSDDLLIQLEPGKVFRWKILREVLLKHLDEIKNLELVDLFYNPKAESSRDDLEAREDGMES